ncbi:MAG: glycosyltransferase family 2 protein [Candidatus Obscuribacterales bacterium]
MQAQRGKREQLKSDEDVTTPKLAVVIPCYRVRNYVLDVIQRVEPDIWRIYVVDDKCPEQTGAFVKETCVDDRVVVIFNEVNQGVGGAVIAGYQAAVDDGADVVIKIDGDGQMDPAFVPVLIRPILEGRADYTKGNRFFRLDSLKAMPFVRVFGNAVLSFMAKLSSGYWPVFDPTNGYTAIHAKVLAELPLDKIARRYFFETDMLFRLNTLSCVVVDVPMKAIYGEAPSNLVVRQVIPEFLMRHTVNFVKRLFYNYFLRNFSIFSVELLLGSAMVLWGMCFGGYMWYWYAAHKMFAPSGVIMFAVLPLILGVQLVLSFFNWDARNVPTAPLHLRL